MTTTDQTTTTTWTEHPAWCTDKHQNHSDGCHDGPAYWSVATLDGGEDTHLSVEIMTGTSPDVGLSVSLRADSARLNVSQALQVAAHLAAAAQWVHEQQVPERPAALQGGGQR